MTESSKKPRRTEAAINARVRAADNKHADRLRSHGWIVLPPEEADRVHRTDGH